MGSWLLAMYLIPGCVGRGVRLGSESSSGTGGAKSGNLEIWGPGNLGIWNPTNIKKNSEYKCGLPKMTARSGLVGTNPPGPIWGQFFHAPEKCKTSGLFAYFPWWANGPYSTTFARYTSTAATTLRFLLDPFSIAQSFKQVAMSLCYDTFG